jgi:GNAT superfamily N-acetyltransferase
MADQTMPIETAAIPSPLLAEYAAIPIAFDVMSVLSVEKDGDGRFVLGEHPVARPYVKDYDAIGNGPRDWAGRFETSQWVLFLSRAEGHAVGGATVALGTPELEVLENRGDLAVLWDIRVAPTFRSRGIGRALVEAAETWALARRCSELMVETQNINVPACRFYEALGFQLRVVREHAYRDCPGEAQLFWYKTLQT